MIGSVLLILYGVKGTRAKIRKIFKKLGMFDLNSPGFQQQIAQMNAELASDSHRTETLRNLDLFVLDNSLRETTVGQLRGHTLENKRKIFGQVSAFLKMF